mmetsp:Transcript_54702/g.144111  ORF Transcript_54702/g.144111 Transcript_54702/m.144111 type:complete len:255 (-) Transcript_54702:250-1014(-)
MLSMGYVSFLKLRPKSSACATPVDVTSPPHFRPTTNLGPSAPTLAWKATPSGPMHPSASTRVPSSWPSFMSCRNPLSSRANCSGERRSNVAGAAAATGAPTFSPASHPQRKPAANSDFSCSLALTFCFGVRAAWRATSSTHRRSSSGSGPSPEDVAEDEHGLAGGARHGSCGNPSVEDLLREPGEASSEVFPAASLSTLSLNFGSDLERGRMPVAGAGDQGCIRLCTAASSDRTTSSLCVPRPARGIPGQTSMT